jgi:endonuclease/exonuclease/phosphatase family metal-dependent hydrolase
LWDNPAPAERNLLNAEMVAQYMPDVLGLQEFNASKRHKAGDKDLVKLLGELGYVETVDPRVKNVGKWGSGGEKVTVGNETFKTFYNCTPLFYNTNTTRCIASEYYWYENQIDAENQGNCGAMDCASKAMTWGVFETIATGERYIVVSTHMCTRSDGIRGLQAREAVAVVNRLIAEYDCPAFFGGDLNGRYIHANHIYFTSEEGGFTDIEQNNLATLYTSKTKSYHRPYPEVNKQYQLIWPTSDDDTGLYDSSESVDHILIHNHKKDTVDITVFGTVVDHCTKSASDHFPIFIDFSIH